MNARYFRIAVVALFADADRAVGHDLADCVTAAGTRITAERVDASRLVRALVIPLAARHDGGEGLADGLLVSDVAIRTFADHGPGVESMTMTVEDNFYISSMQAQ